MQKQELNPTRLQGALAIAAFSVGSVIGCVCLFLIPPYGDIETSAISLVSEFLILCGALLGAKVAFDVRLKKFEGELRKVNDKINNEQATETKQDNP